MPKPSASETFHARPTAMELFTDRGREQEILRLALTPEPTLAEHPDHFLTVFYGVGGVGKTTLCWRARESARQEFKDKAPVLLHLDLDGSGWHPNGGFVALAAEITRAMHRKEVNIQPRLTLALLIIYAQCDGRTATEMPAGLCWDTAVEVIDKGVELSGIPGLGLMLKGARWLRDRTEQDATRQQLRELNLWPVEASGRINLVDLDCKIANALYEDIKNWLAQDVRRHVRLLVDGFERIQSTERKPDAQQRFQEFLGAFAASANRDVAGRFRAVIFGREKLRWDELYDDPGWLLCWNQHLLEGLGEKDARHFLAAYGRWQRDHGNAKLAEAAERCVVAILDAADERRGNDRLIYPFYLDLALEHLQNSVSRDETPDFGKTPAELQDRFFRYMAADEKRALMVLALSGEFDEALFNWLAENRIINFAVHSFHTALRQDHAYFERIDQEGQRWKFHRFFLDALLAQWRASDAARQEAQGVVKRLLEHFKSVIGDKAERDWTATEIDAWCCGFEIIVTHGPESGLLPSVIWKMLMMDAPWSAEHPACLGLRLAFANRTLRGCERLLGPEHLDTLTNVNNLGALLYGRGDLEGAEKLYRRALEAQERLLGPEHPDTLTSVNNLGVILDDRGDLEGAEKLCRRTLEAHERLLGPEHPDTLTSINNLATFLANRGDLDCAEKLLFSALETSDRMLGPDNPCSLNMVRGLAIILAGRGELDGADKYLRRALEAHERLLGPEHPNTLTNVNDLAIFLHDRGDLDSAEKQYRRALGGRESLLGPEHPDTLQTLSNLGSLLHSRGDLEGAEKYCRRALGGRERLLGPGHPDTLRSVNDLATILGERGNLEGADKHLRLALEARERLLGPEHPDTLCSVNDLGIFLHDHGDLDGAGKHYRRALEARERLLGPEHLDTLRTVSNLALLLDNRGDLDGAENHYRRALVARERLLGLEHPGTLDSIEGLARLLKRSGRAVEAGKLLKHYVTLSPKIIPRLRYLWASTACIAGDLDTAKELVSEEIREKPNALDRAVKDSDYEAIREFLFMKQKETVSDKPLSSLPVAN